MKLTDGKKHILPIMQLSYIFRAKYTEDGGINIYTLRMYNAV
jgi:hypothetical protein